jgi:hypothetical protein
LGITIIPEFGDYLELFSLADLLTQLGSIKKPMEVVATLSCGVNNPILKYLNFEHFKQSATRTFAMTKSSTLVI